MDRPLKAKKVKKVFPGVIFRLLFCYSDIPHMRPPKGPGWSQEAVTRHDTSHPPHVIAAQMPVPLGFDRHFYSGLYPS